MISEILKKGKENALTVESIMRLTGLKSRRMVVAQVKKERERQVICALSSYPGGYYLPDSRADVIENLKSIEDRARSTFSAAAAARKWLSDTEGQICMK